MEIVEYEKKYAEDVKRLLDELQDYIVTLDPYGYNVKQDGYRDEVFKIDMDEVEGNNGKVYLAVDYDNVIGLIMGIINGPIDEYDYIRPNSIGEVTELIVTKNTRSKGVGKALLNKMEEYFIEKGCTDVNIDVFGYNDLAHDFYLKRGYHNRMYTVSKKL